MDNPYFPSIRKLAEYETWCNTRALNSAGELTQDQLFQQFPFGLKTIHRTLYHTLNVFRYWSAWIPPETKDLRRWDYDAAVTIEELNRRNTDLCAAYLKAIDDSHAAGLLHQDRRIHQALHLVTHGTHHRTQFITMLRLLGKDPPFEAGDFGGWSNEK